MSNRTEETQTNKIEFGLLGQRVVEGRFDRGCMNRYAGVMLLGATDRKLGLINAAARCISYPRSPIHIKHSVVHILC